MLKYSKLYAKYGQTHSQLKAEAGTLTHRTDMMGTVQQWRIVILVLPVRKYVFSTMESSDLQTAPFITRY